MNLQLVRPVVPKDQTDESKDQWSQRTTAYSPVSRPDPSVKSQGRTVHLRMVPKDQTDKPAGERSQRTTKPRENRPWIKVRLNAKNADAARIVDGWTKQKQGASKVAAAIKLYDAIERGDVDAMRQIGLETVENAGTTSAPSPLNVFNSSDSKNQGEEKEGIRGALVEICKLDPVLNDRELSAFEKDWTKTPYTEEHLRTWYAQIWRTEWPGKNGDIPQLKNIKQGIRRTLEMVGPQPAVPQPAPALADDPEDAADPVEPPRPLYNGTLLCRWQSSVDQLSIQLNRSTFDQWVRRCRLVDVVEQDDTALVFIVECDHRYAVEWLERHLKQSWEKALLSFCRITRKTLEKVSLVFEITEGA